MAVAKETENLTELEKQFNRLAVCSLCQSTFTNPKILLCFHSFCLNCLKENRPTTGNLQGGATANCPTCRADFLIPGKGVADLPPNEFVDSLIATADALSSILQIASFQRTCRGKSPRHIGRSIKNYFVRPGRVSNEDGRQSRASDKIQQKPFCKTHRQKFDSYCNNCTHVMCRLCNGKVHRNHRVISLDSAIKDLRQMMNSYLIGVESCHAYYRAQNNICHTEREGWTSAATMTGIDSTPFRLDSRDRHVQIQSPLPSSSTSRNPETTRFVESWKECTRRFFVIITIGGLRGDILNIAKELHRLHETWCSQYEQEIPVQQSQNKNSPSTRNHTPGRDMQNRSELAQKEQRRQKSLTEQREWMSNEKRMEDIVKKQIKEKNCMEANLKERRDLFADESQKARAKSKPNIADNLHSKAILQTPKVSQDKLEKEMLEAELRELRELNADLQNELTQQLHNEKRQGRELEKLISWIERIDAQSAEFQMATEGHSGNGIIDKVQVSIVKKIKDLSEKNRLQLNRIEVVKCQMEEMKSRASSEQWELKALRDKEKQLLQKIEEMGQQINELRQTSINDEKNHRKLDKEFARERDRLIEEIQLLKKDEKQLNARIQELENQIHNLQYALTQQKEFNHKAALIKNGDETSMKQHLEHSVAHKKELSLIQRELEHLIQWVDTIDKQSTDQITLDEKSQNGVVQKLKSSVIKKTKELKAAEKQLSNRIDESDRQITKLKQSLYSEQQKHQKLRNSNERLQTELVEKERIRKVQEKQLNDRGNENFQLREVLKQQVEPKKSAREKLDQVSTKGAELFTEVTKPKQQRLNTKNNFDDSTAVQIVANRQLTLKAPTGIRNTGNTCYFGATIQNLVYTILLTEELQLNLSKPQLDTELLLTKAYIDFIPKYYEANCDETFRLMYKEFCKKSARFADRGQHDSHDLFVNFLNCLRDEERRRLGSVNSPGFRNVLTTVDKVFGGHTITVYVCSTCKTPYHVCEPFLDISVPILGPKDGGEDEEEDLFINHLRNPQSIGGHDPVRQAVETTMKPLGVRSGLKTPQRIFQKRSLTAESMGDISLKQCLVYYSRTEQIHNEYLCSPCETARRPPMTSALKRTLIYNPPAVLVLHLKRFEQTTVGFKKCNQHVTYDEYLDIGPYCSSSCLRMREPNDANIWYSLYGVVVHKGSLTSGHYVSYIKVRDCDTRQAKQFMQQAFLNRDQVLNGDEIRRINASRGMVRSRKEWEPREVEGQWYLADDEYVKAVEKTEALSQAAYLLFYERVAK